ncbi:MAG: MCP four helix bundle domain-containing protein [Alphaproteobacteria bacterium]|nr:MCP four helix bundle domain-containing protein [Alphaproteobacteria bacterium]
MRFTIKARLTAAFTAVLALTAACAWLAISSLVAVEERFQDTVSGPVPAIESIREVRYYMAQLSRMEKDVILAGDDKKKQALAARVMKLRDGFQEAIKPWRERATAVGRQKFDAVLAIYDEFVKSQDDLIKQALVNDVNRATEILTGRGREASETTLKALKALADGSNPQIATILSALTESLWRLRDEDARILLESDLENSRKMGQAIEARLVEIKGDLVSLREHAAAAQRPEVERLVAAWETQQPLDREVVKFGMMNGTNNAIEISTSRNNLTLSHSAYPAYSILAK